MLPPISQRRKFAINPMFRRTSMSPRALQTMSPPSNEFRFSQPQSPVKSYYNRTAMPGRRKQLLTQSLELSNTIPINPNLSPRLAIHSHLSPQEKRMKQLEYLKDLHARQLEQLKDIRSDNRLFDGIMDKRRKNLRTVQAVSRIQKRWRTHYHNVCDRDADERVEYAALFIQRAWRKYLFFFRIRKNIRERRETAALKIQTNWRRYIQGERYKNMKRREQLKTTFEYFDDMKGFLEREAATKIWRSYRAYKKRKAERLAKRRAAKGKRSFGRSTTMRYGGKVPNRSSTNEKSKTLTGAAAAVATAAMGRKTVGEASAAPNSPAQPSLMKAVSTALTSTVTLPSNDTNEEKKEQEKKDAVEPTEENKQAEEEKKDNDEQNEANETTGTDQEFGRQLIRRQTTTTQPEHLLDTDEIDQDEVRDTVDLDTIPIEHRRINSVANFAAALASPKIPFLQMFGPPDLLDLQSNFNLDTQMGAAWKCNQRGEGFDTKMMFSSDGGRFTGERNMQESEEIDEDFDFVQMNEEFLQQSQKLSLYGNIDFGKEEPSERIINLSSPSTAQESLPKFQIKHGGKFIFQGNLQRYNPGQSVKYISRWCVLTTQNFLVYNSESRANSDKGNDLITLMPLDLIHFAQMKESQDSTHHIFEIHLKEPEVPQMRTPLLNQRDERKKVMTFSADSALIQRKWVATINNFIHKT